MEKKTADRQGIEQTAVSMLKALLCAYVVTGIMLLILTILLYKAGLSEENVNAGIILTYVISTFAGGFVIGKLMKVKKFLWGLLAGVLYFVLLLLISLGVYHALQAEIMNLLTTLLLCAGGGMLGGMEKKKKGFQIPETCDIIFRAIYCRILGGQDMKHIKTLNTQTLNNTVKKGGCGECQTSCQSACKTSCTVGNQTCENRK